MTAATTMTEICTIEEALRVAATVRYRGISDQVARLLYASAQAVPPTQVIVEIGSCIGYSTIFLGFGSRNGAGARVHCLDAWGLPPSSAYSRDAYQEKLAIRYETFEEFLQNVRGAGLTDLVIPHRAYSHRYSRSWPGDLKIGLLFIDGDHSEWGAYADWFLYRPYLADGARVVFHDFGDPAVERAIRRIDSRAIRDGRVVGSGYKGREAFVFTYRHAGRSSWREAASYRQLCLWNACEPFLPLKTLRRLKGALR